MLGPLLGAALDNALRSGRRRADRSGRARRRRHGGRPSGPAGQLAQALGRADPLVSAYIALARLTADRALAAGLLEPERAEELLDVLNEDGGR